MSAGAAPRTWATHAASVERSVCAPPMARSGRRGRDAVGAEGGDVGDQVTNHPRPHAAGPELAAEVVAADPYAVVGVRRADELVYAQVELVLVGDLDVVDARIEPERRLQRLGEH